ncbi:MAG TPA: ChbG/HpnK family deacetylase [Chitinophagaceae bacterium]|nr:ChbG/HpnK family deacetylase [Chitinophagaceae bacterium]HNU14639.1 ChbG/HpnK family deacetylase [Chitinophagaceae bacterium]
MKRFLLLLNCLFTMLVSTAQQNNEQQKIPLLFRLDDIGMCHSVNMAAEEVLKTSMPVSMSVMVPCPWFTEAVQVLKKYPHVSVGIHLTLNAEWKNYRWGPVAGVSAVPSLVDSLGHFFPSRSLLFGNNPKLSEIETELRAQIDKALKAGLKLDYLDYHMGAAMQTLETRAIVEKLAAEYKLSISRYYDEVDVEGGYAAPVANKLDTLTAKVKALQPGGTKLFVVHIGLDTPEMSAMEDLNPFGPKDMSKHRQSELRALLSPSFQQLIHDPKFRIVTYGLLNKEKGLQSMKRPGR